jgi:SOS response regulatory protein OraA/RecX
MPCRDYWPDANQEYHDKREKQQRDKLARIACNALTALEMARPGELGVQNALKDAGVSDKQIEEALTWWEQHQKDDIAAQRAALREKKTQVRVENALSKLSPPEIKLLQERGILGEIRKKSTSTVVAKKATKKSKDVKVND